MFWKDYRNKRIYMRHWQFSYRACLIPEVLSFSLLFFIVEKYKLNLTLCLPKEFQKRHPTSSFGDILWPSSGQLLRVMYQT